MIWFQVIAPVVAMTIYVTELEIHLHVIWERMFLPIPRPIPVNSIVACFQYVCKVMMTLNTDEVLL